MKYMLCYSYFNMFKWPALSSIQKHWKCLFLLNLKKGTTYLTRHFGCIHTAITTSNNKIMDKLVRTWTESNFQGYSQQAVLERERPGSVSKCDFPTHFCNSFAALEPHSLFPSTHSSNNHHRAALSHSVVSVQI